MLLAGDEIGRTQQGNNNSYCQDNQISWINWEAADQELLEFTKMLIHLRREHAAFSRKSWFKGEPVKDNGIEDIAWFLPDGSQMTEDHWDQGFAKSIAVYLNGQGLHAVDPEGQEIVDDNFYIIFNADNEPADYRLPSSQYSKNWEVILDTETYIQQTGKQKYNAGDVVKIAGRSVILLQHQMIRNGNKSYE
jgi:glycogen operon protein